MIRASDLLGCELRTEDGRSLGRVRDLRLRRERPGTGASGPWVLAGLVYGRRAIAERLGIFGAKRAEPVSQGSCVPWSHVVSTDIGRGVIVVRSG